MFQMLQGWTTPFLDPAKTANSSPFDAMCYAYNTFNASYYEIYVSDIDNLSYQSQFNAWDTSGCGTILSIKHQSDTYPISIYPNPSANYVTITGINEAQNTKISIFNSFGQNVLTIYNVSNIDVSSFPAGVYFVKVEQNNKKHLLKFIKEQP